MWFGRWLEQGRALGLLLLLLLLLLRCTATWSSSQETRQSQRNAPGTRGMHGAVDGALQ
jgi:CHASE3 domain sensor protein